VWAAIGARGLVLFDRKTRFYGGNAIVGNVTQHARVIVSDAKPEAGA
jgi:hypothetical protein